MELLTPEEKERLEGQLADLRSKRRELSDRIGAARELGDLKENAEYHAAREDQGLNEAKIREIEGKLANAAVLNTDDAPEGLVLLGMTVKLRDVENGDEDLYRLVGDATGSFDLDYVEVTQSSPMGEALNRARIGEVIRVSLPRGEKRFEVVEIVG